MFGVIRLVGSGVAIKTCWINQMKQKVNMNTKSFTLAKRQEAATQKHIQHANPVLLLACNTLCTVCYIDLACAILLLMASNCELSEERKQYECVCCLASRNEARNHISPISPSRPPFFLRVCVPFLRFDTRKKWCLVCLFVVLFPR